ncbi:hypothetical protein SS1G_06124 [Sclerotinia sclerotiorum 1980 UF-70]|uniref:MADS-box domain-containing protein n=2 Tax=Sclerotinia sclerotiorum (strain ATCC 18683 / 1980 / Ss-1) TaxID=665079 RepID=A7ELC7_SCLS1|nr:hypothetical protein SS1G_06124 [Sclerotinia sclerotiorum 1980 UF-70]APA09699.1 hypothetical protein sscle_05g044690 [Sclerotinia sclerotiorum 1980 UF-70]EDO03643.1 hypothetical protein SS1G_06124 [Sclerotinia sclerotiorum 1980 UF-70]
MGRRKIEIKAIKDDRNRSVTFLKRKGGLFKKAHELSVLCSVDVAVIIFGSNKKLYEYSSSDIGEIMTRYQYYGGANEHKGPSDYGKGKGMDDDDDDDDGSPPSHHGSEPPQMMPPQFQHQPYQHIRHHTPSASPPIPNGVFQHLPQQRQHTPQPGMGSRPSSRNAPRRQSSLVPQHPHGPPTNGQFAYAPNQPPYNPQMTPGLPPHSHGLPQHIQGPPQGIPHPHQSPGPQYAHFAPPHHPQHHPQHHPHSQPHMQQHPQHPQQHPQQHLQQHPQQHPQKIPQQHPHPQQVQQLYVEEQRRSSVPPAFPPQERPASSRATPSPPQPQQQQMPQPPPPPPQPQQPQPSPEQQQTQPSQQMLEPAKRSSVKSRSIFTPIDESRSILSQHWASSTSNTDAVKEEPGDRSQSVDVTINRVKPPSPPQRSQTHNKNRNISMSSLPDGFTPPSRTNSAQLSVGGGKRPILKVQIPEEASDNGGSATAEDLSSPRSAGATNQKARRNGGDHGGMVLPPPSPSASALLSAGASGPPNPFARPHPVTQPSQGSNASGNNNNSNNNIIESVTPVSALPSRFMNNEFLPSPSSFYPEWNYGRGGDSNTLPSPLNFATPVVGTGPSFLRDDNGDRGGKRKTPEQDENRDGGDQKRLKHEG